LPVPKSEEAFEIGTVLAAGKATDELAKLFDGDESAVEGGFLGAADLDALTFLDGLDVGAGLVEGSAGAGIEPGEASREFLDPEGAAAEVLHVDVGDLEFSAGGRLQVPGDGDDVVVVEVQARDGIAAAWFLGLFLDGQGAAGLVELHDAVPFGVMDAVSEDGCTALEFGEGPVEGIAPGEDVVAQDEGDRVIADERGGDEEGLGDAFGFGLRGVGEPNAELGAVAEKGLEVGEVVGGGDDEDIADACEEEGGEGVIDHRLIVDRQKLLTDCKCDWV